MNPIPLAFLLLFVTPQQSAAPQSEASHQQTLEQAREKSESFREAAMHLNQLAGNVHSEEDARAFVDAVAEQFGGGQLQRWTTQGIRHRIARVEFQAVSDPAKLIPEQRIVDIWNEYVREIDAPSETLVSVAEIHNLRDAMLTMSHVMWDRKEMHQLWTIPSIYAMGADGKIAVGCRAVEALKIFHDMSFTFQNIQSARERVQKGILVSDRVKQQEQNPAPRPQTSKGSLIASASINPLRTAEIRYVQAHGERDYRLLLERLFAELFPAD
jgi:hypothetical protein